MLANSGKCSVHPWIWLKALDYLLYASIVFFEGDPFEQVLLQDCSVTLNISSGHHWIQISELSPDNMSNPTMIAIKILVFILPLSPVFCNIALSMTSLCSAYPFLICNIQSKITLASQEV